ncbi:MerR family transcriptional regulator [Sedimentibacter sp.]|uniref:MerR family transcriptional regulator n=1 Tax=Sedimentibacter sp. TaxID=1960295 RepID=UPI00289B740E|nr:MerR family transcriptional regulator [Sedimentibacter sp.]
MKSYYKINEISNLYNIGKDSLRYYEEIGILKPERDTNGYRLYSIQDIWKLNIIKDLRNLSFPMEIIKEYLENKTVENTIDILNEEILIINKKMEQMKVQKNMILSRMKSLKEDAAVKDVEVIRETEIGERKVIVLNDNFSRDDEADFLIKKLHKKHEDKLYLLGNNYVGVTMNLSKIKENIYNAYTSVFFVLDSDDRGYDRVLPKGKYLTLSYRGSYEKTKDFIPLMMEYADKNNYKVLSDPIELYRIDVHETSDLNEYLTELQMLVEQQ